MTPAKTRPQSSELGNFLTPESMITPGGAGGIVAVISNTLFSSFGLPPAHVGLALSFVFGLLVLAGRRVWWRSVVLYVLNSLIIFTVAFGAGHLTPAPTPGTSDGTSLKSLFLGPALAQDAGGNARSGAENPWQNPFTGPKSIFRCPFGICSSPPPPTLSTEPNTDRSGGDYDSMELPDLASCQKACLQDQRCQAYTFAPRGYKHENWNGPTPWCWLKNVRSPASAMSGLTSGVKTTFFSN
jgi:hypothetical protein